MDITGLYAYKIEELAVGIVKADSYEEYSCAISRGLVDEE